MPDSPVERPSVMTDDFNRPRTVKRMRHEAIL